GAESRVRAARAEAGVRHVHDVGVDALQLVVRESHAREHAGREVLGDRVRHRDELAEELLAALLSEIDGDAELLDVVVVERAAEVDAATIVDEWWNAPQDVPCALTDGILDADHLRAERSEKF